MESGDFTLNYHPMFERAMKFKINRTRTFITRGWPWLNSSNRNPEIMASSGFYYLGRSDEVRCISCKVELSNWTQDECPDHRHIQWAPQCDFMKVKYGISTRSTRGVDDRESRSNLENIVRETTLTALTQIFGEVTMSSVGESVSNVRGAVSNVRGAISDVREAVSSVGESVASVRETAYNVGEHESASNAGENPGSRRSSSASTEMAGTNSTTATAMASRSSFGQHKKLSRQPRPQSSRCSTYAARKLGPSHPNFGTYSERLSSFYSSNYTSRDMPPAKCMAHAGFFFNGHDVVCFYCDVTIWDWKQSDDPIQRHFEFGFPFECPFAEYVRYAASPSETDDRLCIICCENEREVCIQPCCHVCSCESCFQNFTNCPVCRSPIKGKLKVYLNF